MRKSPNQLLRDEITNLRGSVEYFKGQVSVLEEKASKLDKMNSDRISNFQGDVGRANEHSAQLLEIIRWHINPETAKFPFRLEKSQRDERDGHGNRF